MRKIFKILTPENVYVEYELAGLGSRFVALLLDHLLQGGILLLVLIGMIIGGIDFGKIINGEQGYNSIVIAVGIVVLFIITFGYFIFFEMIMNGQTPGKKIMKLRTIKRNGDPINFFDSFSRNILRLADMLPSLYLVGAVFIFFTKHYKRIGDFAANTIVVKEKREEQPITIDNLLNQVRDSEEECVNIYPLNNFEYIVLKEFLARKDKLGERRPVFAFNLNKYFMKKFNMENPVYSDPYEFFEDIIRLNSGM